jgi:ferric-dicitrate binding protein FerR (iron transport regulator)
MGDTSVAAVPVAGSFHATNVDVFVRFLETIFHVSANAAATARFVLSKTPQAWD